MYKLLVFQSQKNNNLSVKSLKKRKKEFLLTAIISPKFLNSFNKSPEFSNSTIIFLIERQFFKYSQKQNKSVSFFIKRCTFGQSNGKEQNNISIFNSNSKQGCNFCYIYHYNNCNYPLGVYILHIILFIILFSERRKILDI